MPRREPRTEREREKDAEERRILEDTPNVFHLGPILFVILLAIAAVSALLRWLGP